MLLAPCDRCAVRHVQSADVHRGQPQLPVPRVHRHQLAGGAGRLYLHTGERDVWSAEWSTASSLSWTLKLALFKCRQLEEIGATLGETFILVPSTSRAQLVWSLLHWTFRCLWYQWISNVCTPKNRDVMTVRSPLRFLVHWLIIKNKQQQKKSYWKIPEYTPPQKKKKKQQKIVIPTSWSQ